MDTPVYDFVKHYAAQGATRFHMPGHKGVAALGAEPFDITEVAGADALYEAEGIIAASEKNATALFGFGRTLYSTGGSSQCIKAMLFLARLHSQLAGNNSRTVLAARNVHKSFIHACALLDINVHWLYPENDNVSFCSCPVLPEALARELDDMKDRPIAVYLTSPDYLGFMQDIAGIAEVCQGRGVELLTDNAHGAYLRFLSPSMHAVSQGAFMSCDSAHKTLPVLTGGAYLHLSHKAAASISTQAKLALSLFGSTSPSYLILQSLDLCNRYLSEDYEKHLAEFIERLNYTKNRLKDFSFNVFSTDPLRLTLRAADCGYTGTELYQHLHANNIECEFADKHHIVMMMTPQNTQLDLERLDAALVALKQKAPLPVEVETGVFGKQKLSIREAVFAPHELVPVRDAVGKICALPTVSCPPAIPIVVSGEEITEDAVCLMQKCSINTIEVVK